MYLKDEKEDYNKELFNQEEIDHLKDVKVLIQKISVFNYSLLIISILLIIALFLSDSKDFLKNLSKVLFFSGLLTLFTVIILLILVKLNFSGVFTVFHHIFFPKGGWLFGASDNIIRLYPSGFFYDMAKRIFISHAVKDKALADALVDLLVTGIGVRNDSIFCSSIEGLGIRKGEDFVKFIKDKLENPAVVILLLSPNYFNSVFCVCELGASWALSLKIKPFLVPPLNYTDMKDVLTGIQAGNILDAPDLSDLRDDVIKILKLPGLATSRWEIKRDLFLETLPDIIKMIEEPHVVSREEYNKSEARYHECLEELKSKTTEIKKRDKTISKLKLLKNSEEANKIILEDLTEWEKLQALRKNFNKAVASLPSIVLEALYHHASNNQFVPEDHEIDEARNAAENDYFEPFNPEDDTHVELNDLDPKIMKSLEVINELDRFLEGAPVEFCDAFCDQENYAPKLTSRRFWNNFLRNRW